MTRRGILAPLAAAGLALALLGGVPRAGLAPPEHRETLYVFGTLVELVIRDAPPETARAAAADVAALLTRLHRDWHAWRPGALGDLNAAVAAGRAHEIPPDLAAALLRAQALSCRSGGLFEPGIGALIALWGFHQDTPPEGAPPSPAQVAALRDAAPRIADLTIAGTRVASANPAVRLDLGGFAKGAALALAADRLRARGIADAVLNAGGDVTVTGAHGDRPWRVAIRDPFGWGAVAGVEMRPGESLYTSGNYERFFEHSGTRFAHILDPRTGRPAQGIVSATVLDPDAARADAAATALSVAGPEGWAQTAADMGVAAALLIDGVGRVHATPAMAARLVAAGEGLPGPMRITPLPAPSAAARACPRG